MNEETEKLIFKITLLSEEWYSLIVKDHHKDRDCHWHIETKWSYGFAPVYTVQHHGYILHSFEDKEFSSHKEALEYLKETLIKEIKDYKNHLTNEDNNQTEW